MIRNPHRPPAPFGDSFRPNSDSLISKPMPSNSPSKKKKGVSRRPPPKPATTAARQRVQQQPPSPRPSTSTPRAHQQTPLPSTQQHKPRPLTPSPRPRPQTATTSQQTAQWPPRAQPSLLQIFQSIDTNRNGRISAEELQMALSNGTWRPFNAETCRLLIQMFDADNDGGISFNEFQALWDYINDWSRTFQRFDLDNSGDIDREELVNALTRFGYRLSPSFYDMMMRRFDRMGTGRINFDDFIQLCVMLQILTTAFRHKDTDRDGWIRIHYEEFLTMVLQSKIC